MKGPRSNPLIVALDVADKSQIETICAELKDAVGMFKIGLELYSAFGKEALDTVSRLKGDSGIFLDLKLHDIPTTVKKAVYQLARLDIDILNLHAIGGPEMMRAAMEGAEAARLKTGKKPAIIAVTVLTSTSKEDLLALGIDREPKDFALSLAKLAYRSGLDGVVCSVEDSYDIKKATNSGFLTVCPGIRPSWASTDDQKRVAGPKEAMEQMADYMVVGRPITNSQNMRQSAELILREAGVF